MGATTSGSSLCAAAAAAGTGDALIRVKWGFQLRGNCINIILTFMQVSCQLLLRFVFCLPVQSVCRLTIFTIIMVLANDCNVSIGACDCILLWGPVWSVSMRDLNGAICTNYRNRIQIRVIRKRSTVCNSELIPFIAVLLNLLPRSGLVLGNLVQHFLDEGRVPSKML